MISASEQLGELVPAAREGIDFYEYAARHIGPVSLRVVFHSMAKVRYDLVGALCTEVPTHAKHAGEAPDFHGSTCALYQHMRRKLAQRAETRDVGALVRHEAMLLEAWRDSFEEARDEGNRRIAEILRVHLPRLHACQDELERLQTHLF